MLTLGDSVGLVSQNSTFDQHLYAQGPITLYSTPNTVMSLMGASNLALIGDCGALSIVPNGYAHSIGLASAKVDILLNTSSPDITPANGYTYLYTGQGSSGSIRTIPTYIMNFQSTATTNLFATSVDGSTLTIRSPLSVSGTIPDYVFGLSSGGYIANIGTTGMVQGTHYNHREYVFSANGSTIDSSIPVPVNVGNALVLDAAWGRTLVDTTTTDSSVIVIPEDVGTYELNVSAATMTFDLVNFTRWNKQRIDILLKQGLTTVSFTVNGTPITPVGSFTKVANSLLKLEYNYILSTFSVSSIPEAPLSMLTFSPQAGDYEFVLNDSLNNSVIVQGTDSSPHTFTVPANTSVAFPAGCQIYVFQGGTGTITIAGAGGVTLESPASLQTRAQFSTIVLMKTGTDTWVLTGDIA